jgi:hypothetical protein
MMSTATSGGRAVDSSAYVDIVTRLLMRRRLGTIIVARWLGPADSGAFAVLMSRLQLLRKLAAQGYLSKYVFRFTGQTLARVVTTPVFAFIVGGAGVALSQ